jgi:predicted  nucleic acid-binding Zn-ribbon protein
LDSIKEVTDKNEDNRVATTRYIDELVNRIKTADTRIQELAYSIDSNTKTLDEHITKLESKLKLQTKEFNEIKQIVRAYQREISCPGVIGPSFEYKTLSDFLLNLNEF